MSGGVVWDCFVAALLAMTLRQVDRKPRFRNGPSGVNPRSGLTLAAGVMLRSWSTPVATSCHQIGANSAHYRI